MLTSVHNPRVRQVRTLLDKRRAREEAHQFVVEGVRLVEACLQAGVTPDVAYVTPDMADTPRGAALLATLRATCETVEVSDAVLRAMSDTETPQGVVAVVPFMTPPPTPPLIREGGRSEVISPFSSPPSLRGKGGGGLGLVLIIDNLRDPGNLGALLRSAAGAGVDLVLLAPGTVDLYNPKVVRAGMGAHFQVPALHADWDAITARVAGLAVCTAEADAPLAYYDMDWTTPAALVVGSEAEGVSHAALALATARVSIPMPIGVESLNAAMAATVILFEAVRQRNVKRNA